MKNFALACALLLVACGDDNKSSGDGGGSGSGSDGGGSADALPAECVTAALPACTTTVAGTNVTLRQIGANNILGGTGIVLTSPKNDPRQFVVLRGGQIKIIENEQVKATPFYDINNDTSAPEFVADTSTGERGLLGLAFHPLYKCNGTFFVFYTTGNSNVISRCTASAADPNKADPTCTTVLTIPDFASNHNGGMMEFGPDGYLYVGTGDGGDTGDPRRNGQALTNGSTTANSVALLGKFLRLDVDRKDPGKEYAIPASNPFATSGGAPEIFLIGLRNPWRWSFDKMTGDLWIGDVGQGQYEELDVLKAGEQAGKNLGWSVYEGNTCCATAGDKCTQNGAQQACNPAGLFFPQDVRNHPTWISIIAGEVYRGSCYADLNGWFFYTDFNSTAAGLHRARLKTDGSLEIFDYPTNSPTMPGNITSMHADARGELYLTTLGGNLYHLEATP